MAKPKHILITGVPGSGKTTEATRISEQTGLPMVSLDELPTEYRGPGHWVRPDGARRFMADHLGTPHIIEGCQILGFTQDELQQHDFILMVQPREVIIERLLQRGWNDDTKKFWCGEAARDAAEKLYEEFMAYPEVQRLHELTEQEECKGIGDG